MRNYFPKAALGSALIFFLHSSSLGFSENIEDKKIEAGHSFHGGAFNEGPRQAAVLLPNMGEVEFEITSKSPKTIQYFIQGLGQLHGFWYFEAERSFRQASMSDPESAICYWGMAQANIDNPERARGFLAKAYEHIEKASKREKQYIDAFATYLGLPNDEKGLADYHDVISKKEDYKPKLKEKERRLNYIKKLEDLVLNFPKDLEAKAFLAIQMWFNHNKGIKITSHLVIDSLIQEVLEQKPMHPIHHYRIHIWDRRKHEIALDSAAKCAYSAKGIAHMWHMPGHIYSKAKRYSDAVFHQEASARIDHNHMTHYQILPDQIHNFAHNNEWLVRNLSKLGRVKDAINLAKNMIELPRHPEYNHLEKKSSSKHGRQRLIDILELYGLWKEAIVYCNNDYLPAIELKPQEVSRLKLLGKAYLFNGETNKAQTIHLKLSSMLEEEIKSSKEKFEETKKNNKEKSKDQKVEDSKESESKKKNKAKRKVSDLEKKIKIALAEINLAEYQTSNQNKELYDENIEIEGVNIYTKVKAMMVAKNFEEAIKLIKKDVESKENEVYPLTLQTHLYHKAGKEKEWKTSFEKLRSISEYADIDLPFFDSIHKIIEADSLPKDWRLPFETPTDILERPKLDSLGSFQWNPPNAKNLTLPDHKNNNVSLQDELEENNILLIYYLGAECLHCVEQMNIFTPMTQQYADKGIKIMAVSLETADELADTIGKYSQNEDFPFPILADPKLESFKKYRAYDDFEKVALHGTFLISQDSKILWQDISYEPFTDAEFLLKESERLLNQHKRKKVQL